MAYSGNDYTAIVSLDGPGDFRVRETRVTLSDWVPRPHAPKERGLDAPAGGLLVEKIEQGSVIFAAKRSHCVVPPGVVGRVRGALPRCFHGLLRARLLAIS